ncbi:unnamed protein product [Pleuronectes platessa]|uniref:Uncharacterized protein n=1 Tax=Pleuronectes platessa TaxID=8262 RepID=A0A9N7YVT4_PLEPL|nr:unnamed protein product [Pleuronectes platessa]
MQRYPVGAFARLKQLFSEDPSSEPEEDAKEPDLEANGQPDGVVDREEDRDEIEDNVEDNLDAEVEDNGEDKDYNPVGDASADLSSEEEGQDHGCTTTPTRLVERETFKLLRFDCEKRRWRTLALGDFYPSECGHGIFIVLLLSEWCGFFTDVIEEQKLKGSCVILSRILDVPKH